MITKTEPDNTVDAAISSSTIDKADPGRVEWDKPAGDADKAADTEAGDTEKSE